MPMPADLLVSVRAQCHDRVLRVKPFSKDPGYFGPWDGGTVGWWRAGLATTHGESSLPLLASDYGLGGGGVGCGWGLVVASHTPVGWELSGCPVQGLRRQVSVR